MSNDFGEEFRFTNGKIATQIPNFRQNRGQATCATLHFESDKYQIVETKPGPGVSGRRQNLIGTTSRDRIICSLPLTCSASPYEFGWVLERKIPSVTISPTKILPTLKPLPRRGLTASYNLTNNSTALLDAVIIKWCEQGSTQNCQSFIKTVAISKGKQTAFSYEMKSVGPTPIKAKNRYDISCMLLFKEPRRVDCGTKTVRGDNPPFFDITIGPVGKVDKLITTQRQDCDKNRDKACNTLDFAFVIANYGTRYGDINRDGKTNSLDISLWHKWVDVTED